MRKEIREILKLNNQREKLINKENNEVYTNMIVYLRGSYIDEYNQEQVRADLIEMIIDGQNRGDDIKKIMGGKYKEICDEIIETFPKKTKKQKIMDTIHMTLTLILILLGISVAQSVIMNFTTGNNSYNYGVTLGNLLNMIIIIIISNVIVIYICKNSFKSSEKNKIIKFLKMWIFLMIIFCGCGALAYFLDYVIINISVIYAIIFWSILFIAERIVNSKI